MRITLLDPDAVDAAGDQLAHLLLDALASGASLGFWPSLDFDAARRYWRDVGRGVAAGSRLLVTAQGDGRLLGAAQLSLCRAPDTDCAEVRSMIVHSAVRRRGIGGVLLRALEAEAVVRGRERILVETSAGSGAEVLVRDLGYAPGDPAPQAGACTRFRKQLRVPEAA